MLPIKQLDLPFPHGRRGVSLLCEVTNGDTEALSGQEMVSGQPQVAKSPSRQVTIAESVAET